MPKPSVKCFSDLFSKNAVLKSKPSTHSSSSTSAAFVQESEPPADAVSLKDLIGHMSGPGSVPEKLTLASQRNVSAFLRKDSLRGGVALDVAKILCEEGKEEALILCGNDGLKVVVG